ncbi:MAG: NAD(P)H-dependent oxidoreductase [Candidatus Obscuribacterales bacterium]|nr:NAD(P)H-dependent oxidoreductase [Candidatus Obscuribacterales bacterium]
MADKPRILCFAGSLRRDSFNKKLVKIAMKGAEAAGAEVTYIDLKDYPMPIYDGDIEAEQGIPENAKKIKALMKLHQGFLIACPEYNSSITAVLKNVIDWASRPEPGEKNLECFNGKTAGLMAASPGALGGLRGLVTVRSILGNINMIVLPQQVAVPQANQAFAEDGSLKDAKQQASIENIGAQVAKVTAKLNN